MDFLKNITLNLQATGPAAVLIVWIIAVTCLGIFGTGDKAGLALGSLLGFGALLIGALGRRM